MSKRGSVRIKIDYLEHSQRKTESREEGEKVSKEFKKNLSHFYAEVYAGIFGGKVDPIYKTDIETALNGEVMHFHPDVTRNTRKGTIYTEVKAASGRTYKFSCSLRQAGNYCYKLLEQIDSGKTKPCSDYAFCLYGGRDDEWNPSMSSEELESRLCISTRGMMVAPLNLALFLMMFSPRGSMIHDTSGGTAKRQTYVKPSWKTLRMLREDSSYINQLIKEHDTLLAVGDWSFEDFYLRNLHRESFISPKIRINGRNTLNPFEITRFYFDDAQYADWLAHFRENHMRISEALDIPDNYVPF